MVHQQYHAPPSENFSFASNGSIANTLGTGFFQSGNQFSQYALPANTSFAASALTGDLTWQQLYQLQNSGLNPNAPFLGNPSTNPYVGQGPLGYHASKITSRQKFTCIAIPGSLTRARWRQRCTAPDFDRADAQPSGEQLRIRDGFAGSSTRILAVD